MFVIPSVKKPSKLLFRKNILIELRVKICPFIKYKRKDKTQSFPVKIISIHVSREKKNRYFKIINFIINKFFKILNN
jgi:hypothetical protein